MKMQIKIVFKGKQGTGKSTVMTDIRKYLNSVGYIAKQSPNKEHELTVNTEIISTKRGIG